MLFSEIENLKSKRQVFGRAIQGKNYVVRDSYRGNEQLFPGKRKPFLYQAYDKSA